MNIGGFKTDRVCCKLNLVQLFFSVSMIIYNTFELFIEALFAKIIQCMYYLFG